MLCKRIVYVLTLNEGVLFRTKRFRPDYRYTKNYIDTWDVDELVVLDVTRGKGTRTDFLEAVMDISDRSFIPLTVGSVRDMDEVAGFFDSGADKVAINTAAIENPDLIYRISKRWGSQAIVLSIDVQDTVWSHCGQRDTGLDPVEWAKYGAGLGAGEILLTSMERDGSLQGYDLDLLKSVTQAVTVPVMILGGAGNWKHLVEGVEAGADAVCTQVIHHFTKSSMAAAKRYMAERGVRVRNVLQDMPDAVHPS